MLENVPNNRTALQIQEILEGKIKIDTHNLRSCYYNFVVTDKNKLENALKELKEKGLYNSSDSFIQECIYDFELKISIYNKYLELLREREKNLY